MKMKMNRSGRRASTQYRARTVTAWLAAGVLALSGSGCSLDSLLGNDQLPENVTDPAITRTPKGALRAYYGVLHSFRGAFSSVISTAGMITDELHALQSNTDRNFVDMRQVHDGTTAGPFNVLNRVRGQAMQAIGLQRDFAPDSLRDELTGHLYTLQAYAEIFLADLFCSGIPLSTLDYNGDYTYRPGSTTEQVYEHALALLDTALTLTSDSVRFEYLARIGQARALLNLGRFAEAAAAVADVPDDFSYAVSYDSEASQNFFELDRGEWNATVSDVEGVNGLDYVTSGDPRTQTITVLGTHKANVQFPAKYATDGTTPIVLASGIEARLIEAEALLDADEPAWLDKLNHLRRTMWTTIVPAVAGPLPDLADPGTDDARVDLLYRERAFWLFLTGYRQGDLRRLLRHYGRTQDKLYPVGPYMAAPGMWYGTYVDLPISWAEIISNPHFNGCFSRS